MVEFIRNYGVNTLGKVENNNDSFSRTGPQFKGNEVNITQEEIVNKPDFKKYLFNDVFLPSADTLDSVSKAELTKEGNALRFKFKSDRAHHWAEKNKLFNAALYTAIHEAKKSGVKEIILDNPDTTQRQFAYKAGFVKVPNENADHPANKYVISESSFDKALAKIDSSLKANYEESEKVYRNAERFKSAKRISLNSLTSKSQGTVTLGPKAETKIGQNDDSMKDVQATLSRQGKKVYIKNTGKSDKIKILGQDNLKPAEKKEIKPGDTLRLGNEIYLFDKNKGKYELRFLTKDDKGNFEELFPNGVKHIDFEQMTIGDCYLLSAIKSASENSNGAELLSRMIESLSDSKSSSEQDRKFKVTFPGYSKQSFDVEERKFSSEAVETNDLGVKVLEDAFAQLRETLDWSKTINPTTKKDWLKGGFTDEALAVLTNGERLDFATEYDENGKNYESFLLESKSNPEAIEQTKNFLKEMADQGDNVVLAAGTGHLDEKEAEKKLGKDGIISGHAYSVTGINPRKEKVTVINPWDTSKKYTLSYKDFFEFFNMLGAVRLQAPKRII